MSGGDQDKAMCERLETFEHSSPPTREDMFRFAKAECDLVRQRTEPRERFVLLEDALELSRARLLKIQRVAALLRTECERLRGEKSEATVLQQLIDVLDASISASGLEVLVSDDGLAKEMERVRAEIFAAIRERGDCLNCGGYGGTGHPCSACGGSGKVEDQVRQLLQDQKELIAEITRLRELHPEQEAPQALALETATGHPLGTDGAHPGESNPELDEVIRWLTHGAGAHWFGMHLACRGVAKRWNPGKVIADELSRFRAEVEAVRGAVADRYWQRSKT